MYLLDRIFIEIIGVNTGRKCLSQSNLGFHTAVLCHGNYLHFTEENKFYSMLLGKVAFKCRYSTFISSSGGGCFNDSKGISFYYYC